MYNHINPNDYSSRLNNTVVVYDQYPVNVTVESKNKFIISGIHVGSKFLTREIEPNDPLLDVSTPPLGYINLTNHKGLKFAVYIERLPRRMWKQGLSAGDGDRSSNIKTWSVTDKINLIDSNRCLYSEGYENLVLNNYNTLDYYLKELKDENCLSVAVNRQISIGKTKDIYLVYYKKDNVGWIKPGTKLVKVPSETNSQIISRLLNCIAWEIE